MAQKSDLETGLCVMWSTAKPNSSSKRVGSPFSYLGSVWNLELDCSSADGRKFYRIYLNKVSCVFAERDNVMKRFRVTTFVVNMSSKYSMGYTAEVVTRGRVIWEFDETQVSRDIPKLAEDGSPWEVFCVFHCCQWYMPESKVDTIGILDCKESYLLTELENLSIDFSKLLKKGTLPDMELKCGERTFSAHRAVLFARSGVFRKKLKEMETGVVEVTDLEVEVLDRLLKYMYSGRLEDPSEDTVLGLYKASNKYGVDALKKACSDWISKRLTVENCVEFLIVADAHGDIRFKKVVISFICDHESVLESEVWLKFSEQPSKLANEVYQAFVSCSEMH